MNFQKFIVPVAGVAAVALAYRQYGWFGVVAVATGVVMWLLLGTWCESCEWVRVVFNNSRKSGLLPPTSSRADRANNPKP